MKDFLLALVLLSALLSTCPAANRSVSASQPYPAIVAFGDSFTQGLGVKPVESYPSRLQSRLDFLGLNYEVINAGISGETSQQGLNRLESILAFHPRIVIVEFGANDVLQGFSNETTQRYIAEIVSRLRKAGAIVLVAEIETAPERTRGTGAAIIPFLSGVAGNPGLNQEDGMHPNAEGYRRVEDNVWTALRPLL